MDSKTKPSLEDVVEELRALKRENETLKKRLSSLENPRKKKPLPIREDKESDPLRYGYLSSAGFGSHLDRDLSRVDLIEEIVRDYYSIYGYEKTKEAFPDSLQGSFGVLKSESEIKAMCPDKGRFENAISHSHRRYIRFGREKGEEIYLCNQWKGTIEEGLWRAKKGKSLSQNNFYSFVARACSKFDYQVFTGDETYGKEDFPIQEDENNMVEKEPWTMKAEENFRTIVEIINKFGGHCLRWQRGSWPWDRPNIPFVLCFIWPGNNGSGWINEFPNPETWVQTTYTNQKIINDLSLGRIRLLFVHDSKQGGLTFYGAYRMEAPYDEKKDRFLRVSDAVSYDPEQQVLSYTTASHEEVTISLAQLNR